MSLRFLHQVIIFAAITVALVFAAWCFFDPSVGGNLPYTIAGVICVAVAVGLVFYEIHFLKRTRKILIH
jgi:hypothetical protein